MTEQTPQDAYIESCLIDLSKKLTAAEKRNKELEAALREIANCVTLPAQNDIEMREIASAALGEKKDAE